MTERRRRTKTYMHDPSTLEHWSDNHVPETPVQAIMEADIYDEPEESALEKAIRLDGLRDALESDLLTPRERWVIEARYWRRLSLAQVGRELGGLAKSTVWRIERQAFAKIAAHVEASGGVGSFSNQS